MQFRYTHPTYPLNSSEARFKAWLIKAILDKNNRGFNFMGCVLGEPGVGKSALVLRIMQLILEELGWTPEEIGKRIAAKGFIYFSLDEFFNDMDNLEKGFPISFDEAAVTQDAHFWRSMDAEDYKHITTMWRYKLWNCFYALPDFSFLLKSQRLLTHAAIVVEQRGYAKVHGIVKDYFGASRTRWSDSKGDWRELRGWPMPDPLIWNPYHQRKDENFVKRSSEIEQKVKLRRLSSQLEQSLTADMMVQ